MTIDTKDPKFSEENLKAMNPAERDGHYVAIFAEYVKAEESSIEQQDLWTLVEAIEKIANYDGKKLKRLRAQALA